MWPALAKQETSRCYNSLVSDIVQTNSLGYYVQQSYDQLYDMIIN